uniref:At1g61320/AtMIF1 LRR domain-containing protein n=1 Tax=Setaria viridis TaxID=4556 RepID=A0A4U6VZX4_SETVI|nr:hypothetical protein SEVIR_2G312100v2 [Setaria viridis]
MGFDIWNHIRSLVPLRDAARAACVSGAFLRSWRCHPNLTLTVQSLGYFDFTRKVDHILEKHSGVGVKKLDLEFIECYNANANDNYIFVLKYEFPCSVLSDGSGSSIRYLDLEGCAFRPAVQLGHLGCLARLHLHCVHITGDELECLLSNSLALERLELRDCHEIICLKIPYLLCHLSYLHVYGCNMLRAIENKAPNLRSICLRNLPAQLPPGQSQQLGESLQLKNIEMWCFNPVYYARAELPLVAPNLETLTVGSMLEMVNTPMAPSRFLHLKHLSIHLIGVNLSPEYDYFLLASFIDDSPSLKTFILRAPLTLTKHESIIGGSSDLRQMSQHRHHNLQSFKITCCGSAKTLIELTCHVLENTSSLECVTLDTTTSEAFRCSDDNSTKCVPMPKDNNLEAQKALLAIEMYIKMKVPDAVKLDVVEPCRRCHAIEL